ncbi:MAG: GntR family transcriptional regulator [Armatimonadetes bacterium]|nr:GntR family transcriptional regulator [Armatimonadota bacterium]
MFIQIDATNGMPIYLQIVEQVKHGVASGALAPGDRIPSVREMAVQIRVNPNTIAKAYQELERQRVVEFRRGNGTFVGEVPPDLSRQRKRELVARHLDRALVEAHHVGLSGEEVEALLVERVKVLAQQRKRAGGKP